jgi:hypothetical protein
MLTKRFIFEVFPCNGAAAEHLDEQKTHLAFVAKAVEALLRSAAPNQAPSENTALLAEYFSNPANQEAFFCNSTIFERAKGSENQSPPPTPAECQLSAKLHCLFGVPIMAVGRTRSSHTYPYACSIVYDMRNYTPNSMWGPFRDDASQGVDWEKVEAIMVVLGRNLKRFDEGTYGRFKHPWKKAFIQAVPNSYVSTSKPQEGLALPLDSLDPYGVTGTWERVSSA